MKDLLKAGIDGFIGSFRLAGALIIAIVAVTSAFVHDGPQAAKDAARHTTQ